ncbi:hypothetical protein CFC21_089711 [Triticum aestivum]|uniref:Stigma-specific STIG1-like protein 1 n=2 Tax=Triticum aestivum TaxID=4565 RepID=A0A9R1IMC1_WHEAT|nr:hypothetical protein CFC21_089711 [Triticum aestivum]
MASAALLLLITVLATAGALIPATAGTSASLRPPARRSSFLLVGGTVQLPLTAYACSKKSTEACLATGTACCSGQCVDTAASVQHCGGCNKACKHGRTCCGGRCVDLLSNEKNCGTCSNQCNKKCSYGFCDYPQ